MNAPRLFATVVACQAAHSVEEATFGLNDLLPYIRWIDVSMSLLAAARIVPPPALLGDLEAVGLGLLRAVGTQVDLTIAQPKRSDNCVRRRLIVVVAHHPW